MKMKLLNREPTEEMIRAACISQSSEKFDSYESWLDSHTSGVAERIRKYVVEDYRAMYDAATELTVSLTAVDMEPFGYIGNAALAMLTTKGVVTTTITNYEALVTDHRIYSDTQLAAAVEAERKKLESLQAENERLLDEIDTLHVRWRKAQGNYELHIAKLILSSEQAKTESVKHEGEKHER